MTVLLLLLFFFTIITNGGIGKQKVRSNCPVERGPGQEEGLQVGHLNCIDQWKLQEETRIPHPQPGLISTPGTLGTKSMDYTTSSAQSFLFCSPEVPGTAHSDAL